MIGILTVHLILLIASECRSVFDVDDKYLLSNLIKEDQERFTLYRLTLSDVPSVTNAEDFKVDLIGSEFLMIRVDNTTIQWRIRLDNRVPNHLVFYPEFAVSLLSSHKRLSTWEVFVRIPKFFDLNPTTLKIDEL
ncbi:hypothetical protein MACK_001145 [Theileria orientalis]|uniref:Uncharacterized protein n=1 Tax=Theileria orientalis TaxID=68886 RepID=A0A976MCH8_THEOR|nr:hypothetical protein MACK_001145 [Theileria orientalis]